MEDIKEILNEKRFFYSMELYPPEFYDDEHIIKNIKNDQNNKQNYFVFDDITMFEGNKDVKISIKSNEKIDEDVDIIVKEHVERDNIINYINNGWVDSEVVPLNCYTKWLTVNEDMTRLSMEFSDWIFILYSKCEIFMDKINVMIFRNGKILHSSNNILIDVKIVLPNGNFRNVKDNKILLNKDYEVKTLASDDKAIGTFGHVFTDLTVMLGGAVADLGSLAAEAAVAAKILAVGLKIVDEMHTNLKEYNINKGKCSHLVSRCDNIVGTLQTIPEDNLGLKYILAIVQKIEEARILIKKYLKQWRITKFFSSKDNKRKFNDANQDLTDTFNDFNCHLGIQQWAERKKIEAIKPAILF